MNTRIIQVVLVRPDDDGNIGAVCRAMKTMGISSLCIVGRSDFDSNRVRTLALHAFDIFENAAVFDNLPAALEDSIITAGISRRRGKRRKYISYSPETLAEKLSGIEEGTVSLVFGNEEHGLTDSELAACNMAVTIPSSDNFPSLNLSHAVQIIGYVLHTWPSPAKTENSISLEDPAGGAEIRSTADRIALYLEQVGFFSYSGPEGKEETALFFRDIIARALISKKEGDRLEQIFRKAAGLIEAKNLM